jgi:hypothetical protein
MDNERQNPSQNEDQKATPAIGRPRKPDRQADGRSRVSGIVREGSMHMKMAATIAFALCCSATSAAEAAAACSDRNILNDVSVDARLTAIRYYFVGLVRGSTDRDRQACYEAHVLNDATLAILNKTLALVESECLTIESAAQTAVESTCP